jgi:hypothetical protein
MKISAKDYAGIEEVRALKSSFKYFTVISFFQLVKFPSIISVLLV